MAEPDWALWQSILQQLQADSTEIKADLKALNKRVAEVEKAQSRIHHEVTYALGMMISTTRELKDAQDRIDEVVRRLEKLEAH